MSMLLRWTLCFALVNFATSTIAEPLRVLASIKPLQLLAIAVGGDAVRVDALLAPQFSPHDYQLRPSDRAKLGAAEVLFWIGPRLEVFLQPILQTLPKEKVIVSLQTNDIDAHIWLDPLANIVIAQRMADVFSQLRPTQQALFHANAERLASALTALDSGQRAELKQIPTLRGYMVEHDGYGLFERRYGFKHLAALTNAADIPPSAATILRIEKQLSDDSISCVWREPQESKLLSRLIEGKNLRVVTLDAMAAQIPLNQNAVLEFQHALWRTVMACLKV